MLININIYFIVCKATDILKNIYRKPSLKIAWTN